MPTIVFACLAFAAIPSQAAGEIDGGFGVNGYAFETDRPLSRIPRAVAFTGDGRIAVAGACDGRLCVARYLADGRPDPSFGPGAPFVTPTFPGVPAGAYPSTMAMQADGKWVLAGSCADFSMCAARLNANGSADTAFGGGTGIVHYGGRGISGISSLESLGVVAQANGTILLSAEYNTQIKNLWLTGICILRLLGDGTRDPAFGTSASLPCWRDRPRGYATSVPELVVQPGGAVVAAVADGGPGLLRINGDGGLDSAFPLVSAGLPAPILHIGALQEGRLLVHGLCGTAHCVVRRTADGSAEDVGFGVSGMVTLPFEIGQAALVTAPDDSFFVIGPCKTPLVPACVARYRADGTLHWTATVGATVSNETDNFYGIAYPDGGALVLRSCQDRHNMVWCLTRLKADGSIDDQFMNTVASVDPLRFLPARLVSASRQGDGRIVVVGTCAVTSDGGTRQLCLSRFNGDGSRDEGYGTSGRALGPAEMSVLATVDLDHDQRLVMGICGDRGCTARFDVDGMLVEVVQGLFTAAPRAMERLPDGRLLGVVGCAAAQGPGLQRLQVDYSLDRGFGGNTGCVSTPGAADMRATPEGGAVVRTTEGSLCANSNCLLRFRPDGTPDTQFNQNAQPPNVSNSTALAVRPDGRLTFTDVCASGKLCIRQYLTDGRPDPAWRGGSAIPVPQLAGIDLSFSRDGSLLLSGPCRRETGNSYGMCIGRVSADGSVMTWADGTNWFVDLVQPTDTGKAVSSNSVRAIEQADGRLVLASSNAERGIVLLRIEGLDGAADTDGDGVPNSVELAYGDNPRIKDNDIFSDSAAGRRRFVMQMFRDFLGREADPSGLAYWQGELANQLTRAAMAQVFLDSGEYQDRIAPVIRLYQAAFQRLPDTSGFAHWVAQRQAGMTLEVMAEAFVSAPEFAARYGTLDNASFVQRIYLNLLGREADDYGRNYWQGQLDSGTTRGAMLAGFADSAEYRRHMASTVAVVGSYFAFLCRAPDQSGFDYWRAAIDHGVSAVALTGLFVASEEYRQRFLP